MISASSCMSSSTVVQFDSSASPCLPLSQRSNLGRERRVRLRASGRCVTGGRRPRFSFLFFFTHSAKFIRFELWSYGPAVVVHTLLLGADLETGPPGARSGFRFGNGIFILLFCTLYLSRIWNVEKGIKSSWAWGLRHKSGRIDYRFTKFTALPWALPTPTTRQNARRRPDRLRHQTTRRRTPLRSQRAGRTDATRQFGPTCRSSCPRSPRSVPRSLREPPWPCSPSRPWVARRPLA